MRYIFSLLKIKNPTKKTMAVEPISCDSHFLYTSFFNKLSCYIGFILRARRAHSPGKKRLI